MRHGWRHGHDHRHHHRGPRHPWRHFGWATPYSVAHHVRARLHRRLFWWFGATTLLSGVLVSGLFAALGQSTGAFRQHELVRYKNFIGHRFAAVWERPAERDALARALADDLRVEVVLRGGDKAVLGRFGPDCKGRGVEVRIQPAGADTTLGTASICFQPPQHGLLRLLGPLFLALLFMWGISGKIARRVARPLGDLAGVARQIGRGHLAAREQLRRGCEPDEVGVVADAIHDMAARLERQLNEQRVLLAQVSHELRTPLGHLRVLTELIRENGADGKTLDAFEAEVVEIDALVGELLASSRIEFSSLSRASLDAADVAGRALERAGLPRDLLAVAGTGDPRFEADPTLLARALANLLDNAKKHAAGPVALRVYLDAAVRFEVDDEGPGFGPDEERKAFEPFYRRAPEGESTGLGLGLSLVKRIAEAHGGTAYARNRPGRGATVGMSLPRRPSASAADADSDSDSDPE